MNRFGSVGFELLKIMLENPKHRLSFERQCILTIIKGNDNEIENRVK